MKQKVLFTGPVIKVLAIFVVVVGFSLIIYSMSGFPAPRESDRITALDGSFSIIKPNGWDSRVTQAPPETMFTGAIDLSAPNAIGIGERLFVGRIRLSPDMEKLKTGFKPLQFQGREAWVLGNKTKVDYVIQMVFSDEQGAWYKMELRVPRQEELSESKWWPFLTSFKSRPRVIGSTNPGTTIPSPPQ